MERDENSETLDVSSTLTGQIAQEGFNAVLGITSFWFVLRPTLFHTKLILRVFITRFLTNYIGYTPP
jgi:hypothetical protein